MDQIWTIGSILTWTKQYFSQKGVENPRLDAEVLLSHILGTDRLYLYVHHERPLDKKELGAFREAVKKRAMHIPVAYITGCKEFMGKSFTVSPEVLIPRPDTEILVESIMNLMPKDSEINILDIGTGSGAIIISLLAYFLNARGCGADISEKALAVAKNNAQKLGVSERLTLVKSDIFSAVNKKTFDVIVSNPPYIPDEDIKTLSLEVQQEPRIALAGGRDGLNFYRRIIKEAPRYLCVGGILCFEVGINQAEHVTREAEQNGLYAVKNIVTDYGGIERVVILNLVEAPKC